MRMQTRVSAAILTAVLLGAGALPAAAQKSADTLRIVMRDALPNIDPYYNNLRTGVVMHHQGWDALVYRNPDTFKLEPLLATEWKLPDATTIEFTLRPGVRFHDGSAFTADDAVFSIERALAVPSQRAFQLKGVTAVKKIDALTIELQLAQPDAVIPEKTQYIAMMSKA